MIKNYYFLLFLICSQVCFSQARISEEEKIENLIRVWGLVKYQHPEVSRGNYNINAEFLSQVEKLENIGNRQDFNSQVLSWLESLGTKDLKPKENWRKREQLFSKNADFEWISNSGFSKDLQALLKEIQLNKNYKDYYVSIHRLANFVDFTNDKPLANFDATNKAHRLLFLAHFWNAMKYWNVNIYLTDTAWSQVLPEMIPEFIKKDQKSFDLAKEKLFTKLNDSHANYYPSRTLNSLTHFPNFGGRIINDSLVITRIFNEDSIKENTISVGDIIYSVEGVKLKKYYTDKFSQVISVSNENYLKREIENSYLLSSDKDSIKVGALKKNGVKIEEYIRLDTLKYPYEKYQRKHPEKTENWKMLSEDIGYMNLYEITKDEVDAAFQRFERTKGIIIDLRNYPQNISQGTLPKHLYPRRKKFVKALTPKLPSYGNPDTKTALRWIMNPFAAGRRNRNYYKGKVILLVDRSTLSKAEWIGMAIQAAPNVITVGEQSGGAVLNRNEIMLMDSTSIDFTKATAFYPKGPEVHRNGLKLDVEIEESAINYNKDLYLEIAKNIIKESRLP
ncbi:S41 family peptidase [Salegentibacter flavus]|uniref:C-terminal processing protease CtpA/Prc, contains a PDZ domain n=1 Tax=Salegentibacter flavus TaxID=287099 RepID=A0A1I4YGY6_9FLAO|nr:S41 family peptidase [Salegentibacter flavus]SFN37267.1 C-terminal processing protease CtpA/Prc, contains a PDZ domain [Salegentibacter flavus]